MARYPTFDEYAKRGAYNEGVSRCNELLQRSPKDVQLLLVKLQLLSASSQKYDETLDQLLTVQPPIQDLRELVPIEAAIVDANQDTWPPLVTAGPQVAKLWDNALKANTNTNYRLDLLSVRFSRAVVDDRIQDAQQSLIALVTVQPKNRALYMARAAYTQLLSNSKDDLSSRLALSLAKKAVTDKFDDDKKLDCRVAGQIFALQKAEAELASIRERAAFNQSKQVFEALGLSQKISIPSPEKVDMEKVPSYIWLMSTAEQLKAEFGTLVEKKASRDVMTAFVANAIRLFPTSITSLDLGRRDRGAVDVCFLAVSGLVYLFSRSNDTTYLLQAAYLANRLLKFNEHIHEARLILVYLYMRLNLGSLAMRFFDSLNVKEIQHDTIGHSLFSRLSTVHPAWTKVGGERAWFDPHERTHKALGIYPRHEDKLADTEAGILEHSQTGMIFDLHRLRVEMRSSISKRMMLLEHRRIARLTGKPISKNVSDVGPRVVANWVYVKDNRDFNSTFNYGINVEKAIFADNTTELAQGSLLHDLTADTVWSLATGKPSPLILDPENLHSAATPSNPARALTSTIATQILTLLLALKTQGTSPTSESLKSLLKSLSDLNIPNLTSSPHDDETLTSHLDLHYLYLDTLRIVLAACTYITKHAANVPEEVAAVQVVAKDGMESLQRHAKEQARRVVVGSVGEMLVMGTGEGLKMFGEESLRHFTASVMESAREGWEGVESIKAMV